MRVDGGEVNLNNTLRVKVGLERFAIIAKR